MLVLSDVSKYYSKTGETEARRLGNSFVEDRIKLGKAVIKKKWSQEAKRGSSQALPLIVNCGPQQEKTYLAFPTEEDYTFLPKLEEDFLLAWQQPSQ